jgi:sensor histidine kinase regulating citrate/malate metabolism
LNIAEMAHMEDEEDKDQDTAKSKVETGVASRKSVDAGGKRSSVDLKGRSLDKTVTLTRQAADSNRYADILDATMHNFMNLVSWYKKLIRLSLDLSSLDSKVALLQMNAGT